jgi:hypothetical protein
MRHRSACCCKVRVYSDDVISTRDVNSDSDDVNKVGAQRLVEADFQPIESQGLPSSEARLELQKLVH